MIQKINDRLNEYLEFDNNQLYMDSMVRIFGGAIRDSIADQPINDVDILCGAQSLRKLEYILEKNGYHHFEKLTSVDITNLYSTDVSFSK
jgi:tRNA nucleotidyltransferase/poly(A) polymerase